MTDMQGSTSVPTAAPNQSNAVSINIPADNSEVVNFFSKYSNDPAKVFDSYRNMQSMSTKAQEYLPAKEYNFPQGLELPNEVKKNIYDTATKLEVSQKTFSKMVEHAAQEFKSNEERSKQAADMRSLALGGKEGEDALKAFFADKVPSSVLDKVLKDSSIETLQELKSFRDKSLAGDSGMSSEASTAGDPSSRIEQLAKLKSQYNDIANKYDQVSSKKGPNHPEAKVIEAEQLRTLRILEAHVANMNKFAENEFRS